MGGAKGLLLPALEGTHYAYVEYTGPREPGGESCIKPGSRLECDIKHTSENLDF